MTTQRRLAAFTITAGTAGWFVYDYRTRHPMRQVSDYEWQAGVIRLHNLFLADWKPLMTLEQLSTHQSPKTGVYFTAGGYVYDVTKSEMFDSAYAQWKGKDATVALARMSLDAKDVNNLTDWHNLTTSEQDSLDSWERYFKEKYWIRGRLKEYCDDKVTK